MRLSLWLVSAMLLAAVACAQSPDVAKRKALERGERFLKDGKASEAIIELRAALAIDRDFLPALHALGRAYAAKAWAADAVRELERAHGLAPDSMPIAEDLGRSLLQANDWPQAEKTAAKILSREPLHSGGLYVKAAALVGQGKLDAAQQALAAIPTEKMTPELEAVRGDALLRAGKVDEAERAFRTALAADARTERALIGLGRASLIRRNFKEALDFFRQAKDIRPGNPEVRLGMAEARGLLGRTAEAIAELEELDPHARSLSVQLSLARYYLVARRSGDAIPILIPIVERAPKLSAARQLLGQAYLATRRPEQAAAQFDALVRLEPNETSFQLLLATALVQQGRGRQALERLDGMGKTLERTASYHTTRAGALLALGRLEEAARAAETAQRLAPQEPEPYLIVGLIRAQQGRSGAARDLFTRALDQNANYAPAHLALGQLYAQDRQSGAALAAFERAVETNPGSVVAVHAKAAALLRERKTKEAVEFLEAMVTRDPKNADFHALLGSLHAAIGQPDKAAPAFRKAIELDPHLLVPRLGLARLAMQQKNDKEAIAQLQAATKEHPDHLRTVLLLVSLHEKLAQYDLAVSVLEEAAKAGASPSVVGLAIAQMHLKQGRYDDVIARTSETLKQTPEATLPRLLRGQALLAKGGAAAAVKDLSEVARVSPKWAMAHYLLARALVAAGRGPEAQTAYRQAVALDPGLGPIGPGSAAPGGKAGADDPEQRFRRIQDTVKADPSNLEAREALVLEFLVRRQISEAEAELKQVLERAPGRAPANILMARILLAQDKPEDAAAYLRAALKSNPSLIEANLLLAQLLQQRGRREEALTQLQAALRTNRNLGNLHPLFAKLPDALALAQELERREPKSPGPAALVGWIMLSQQSPEAAAEAFRRAIRIKPDFGEGHRGLGQALQITGQADRAIESYRQAIAVDRNDAMSLNNLAWLLLEARKRPDEALPLAVRAVQLTSGPRPPAGLPPAAMLDTLGWIQYRRGAYGDAERALARAAELAPKNAAIHFHLGATQSRLGKKKEAAAALRRAAELSPDLARAERIPELLKELGG